ncbi:UDP-glucose 4-epimerase GalE [Uliginosibacterium sp. sgz301328]|uniref:UDP-glucose 4-epimerase GalE n=1 Tax=Uliginosibacterium sp. sgz301328 TaxID=3243764 RepID=UPI00359DB6B0
MACILVTGGAGYIGTHTAVELLQTGHDVVVVDNLCNSKAEAVRRVEEIAGRKLAGFHTIDVRDRAALAEVFRTHRIDAVIHFAALKAVGESVAKPLAYYDNNIAGTVALAETMAEAGVKTLVFSSSATVYGDPASVPIREDFPTGPTNPYGRTKWMMEYVLRDVAAADPEWRIALLRYFNPVGAHESGRIGEDPNGLPNNLMPFVTQVAVGKLPRLRVFGGDYATPDGTGMRDYIHVCDLAVGHVKALDRLRQSPGVLTVNLGTGQGYSVLDVVRAFERASGRQIPFEIVARRAGDIAQCWADPAMAERELGWRAERDLDCMCADSWRWQSANPNGYN